MDRARHQKGTWGRFLKACILATMLSFGVSSYALMPQVREQIALDSQLSDAWESLGGVIPLAFLGLLGQQTELAPPLAASGQANRSGASSKSPVSESHEAALVEYRFKECPQFFAPGRAPMVPKALQLRELCFSGFAVLHSGLTKTPVFVAQRLNRQLLQQAQSVGRQDRFYEEARLPERERARLSDYRGSGFARGHMAPAGDMHSPEAMAQSFSLANMVPQNQQQNAGPWNQVEQATRKYVMRAKGDVYVLTGPFYEHGLTQGGGRSKTQTIGEGRVAVPSHLYKLVYDPGTGRSWVHWQANDQYAKAGPPISYEEFVRRTGLHLLGTSP